MNKFFLKVFKAIMDCNLSDIKNLKDLKSKGRMDRRGPKMKKIQFGCSIEEIKKKVQFFNKRSPELLFHQCKTK